MKRALSKNTTPPPLNLPPSFWLHCVAPHCARDHVFLAWRALSVYWFKNYRQALPHLLEHRFAHPRDSRIQFYDFNEKGEKVHEYTIDGQKGKPNGWVSVTGVLGMLWPPFVEQKAIISSLDSHRKETQAKYRGMTPRAISAAWEANRNEAATLGTATHLNLEHYFDGMLHCATSQEFALFMAWRAQHPTWQPVRVEMNLFCTRLLIMGQADIIMYDTADHGGWNRHGWPRKVILGDWKRSKKIEDSNRYEHGSRACTADLDKCNREKYSLQLCVYKLLLERHYEVEVVFMFNLIVHPAQEAFLLLASVWTQERMNRLVVFRHATLLAREQAPGLRALLKRRMAAGMQQLAWRMSTHSDRWPLEQYHAEGTQEAFTWLLEANLLSEDLVSAEETA